MPAPITPMREDRLRTSTSGAKADEDTADWLTGLAPIASLRPDSRNVSATGNARIRTLTFPPPPVNRARTTRHRRRQETLNGHSPSDFKGEIMFPRSTSDRALRVGGAVAAATALALLAGCSSAPAPSSGDAAGSGGGGDEKFVIGFEQPLGGQAWRETGLAALQALANRPEYKDKVELKIVRTNDNDAAAQNAAMQNLIAQGVDAILFDPASSSGADAAIAQATAQKIPVIANGGPYDSEDVYVVSTDWASAGTVGAQWLLDNLGDNKKVAVLEGLAGVPLNDGSMPGVIK